MMKSSELHQLQNEQFFFLITVVRLFLNVKILVRYKARMQNRLQLFQKIFLFQLGQVNRLL